MRERKCMTMMDPFYDKYGKVLAAALSVFSVFVDLMWVPTTLTGLGTSLDFLSTYGVCVCVFL